MDKRQELITDLQRYQPWNEQESEDLDEIIRQLRDVPDIFTRNNKNAHMTASSWIVNHDRTRALMVYHNIYDSWAWTGGHADGEEDLLSAAMREAREETSISQVRPVSDGIFSLEILTVDGHVKKGRYVSSHLHLNVTYLLEADDTEPLHNKADENKAAAWFDLDDAVKASNEPWFRERIYTKLNQKLRSRQS